MLFALSDGLMSLLKQIGQAYVYLSSYECKQALNAFLSLAPHHYNTGWVLTQVGRAHFELADYRQVRLDFGLSEKAIVKGVTAEYSAPIVFLKRYRLKNEAYSNTRHSYANKWPGIRSLARLEPS